MRNKVIVAVFTIGLFAFYMVRHHMQTSGDLNENATVQKQASVVPDNTTVKVGESTPSLVETRTEKKETKSLLAQYPGFGHDMDNDEKRYSEEEAQRESMISDCMARSGFVYVPAPSIEVRAEDLDSEKNFEKMLDEAQNDPNEKYVGTLSADMKKSYYMTLYGTEDPNSEESTDHDYALENDSCTAQAHQKIPGVYSKRIKLSEAYDELERKLEEHELVKMATEQWSDCMSKKGHYYNTPAELAERSDSVIGQMIEQGAEQQIVEQAIETQEKYLRMSKTCDQKAELTKTRKKVKADLEDQFVQAHIQDLES